MGLLIMFFLMGAVPLVLLYLLIFQPKVLLGMIGALISFIMIISFGAYLFMCLLFWMGNDFEGPFFQDAITPIMEMFEEESEDA